MRSLFVAAVAVSLAACVPNYSEGSRVGTVNKLSRKGLIFKSWEGEMNLGGFRNRVDQNGNSRVVANVFEFSVTNPEIVKQIEASMRSGEIVELTYNQYLIGPPTLSTPYVIVAATKAE